MIENEFERVGFMNIIDILIWGVFMTFIVINLHKAYENNWYKKWITGRLHGEKIKSPVMERREFYEKFYSEEIKEIKRKIQRRVLKKHLERIKSKIQESFNLETTNSKLIFLATCLIILLKLINISPWVNFSLILISLTIFSYIAYDKLMNFVKRDPRGSIGYLIIFPLMGFAYTFLFLVVIDDEIIALPMLILSVYFMIVTLVFAINISNVVIKPKLIKLLYTLLLSTGILFMSYFAFGYALYILEYGVNNTNIFINTGYKEIVEFFSFVIAYGQSTILKIPELVFINEESANNIEPVKASILQVHIIGAAYLSILTSLNFAYLSRIIFQENEESIGQRNSKPKANLFTKRW